VDDHEQALQRALELAYRYLNRRERSIREVSDRLAQAGIDRGPADEAIEELQAQGIIDDARFARLFAQDKRELEQWGSDRITRGLRDRGIDPDLIEATLAADQPAESELDRALELLKRRFPEPPRDRRERDRALGVLVRKGYDGELALDALRVHASADR
jgi:regulatory protein